MFGAPHNRMEYSSTTPGGAHHHNTNSNSNTNTTTTFSVATLHAAADDLVRQYQRWRALSTTMDVDDNNNQTSSQPTTPSPIDTSFRHCICTLLKLIQNVLKYTDPNHTMYHKVRRIPLYNPTIQQHVVHFPHTTSSTPTTSASIPPGVAFLYASGFTNYNVSSSTSSVSTTAMTPPVTIGNAYEIENTLVLWPMNEDKNHLQKAQQLLTSIAIYELHISPHELPGASTTTTSTTTKTNAATTSSSTTTTNTSTFPGGFNPYQGYRMDLTGQTNTSGSSTTATTNTSTSKIDWELQQLQQAQQQLLARASATTTTTTSRTHEWTMTIPNTQNTTFRVEANDLHRSSTDGALLAQRMQQQTMVQRQREQGGLATKAMRELERLKQAKIYTEVSLSIQVTMMRNKTATGTSSSSSTGSNAIVVQFHGKFLPHDTIDAVMTALRNDCFVPLLTTSMSTADDTTTTNNNNIDFELYSTPPMITYHDTKRSHTLQQEQLVPASKLFLRWIVPTVSVVPNTKRNAKTTTTVKTTTTAASNPIYMAVLQPKWLSMIESHWNGSGSSPIEPTTTSTTMAFPKAIPIVSALPTTTAAAAKAEADHDDAQHPHKKPASSATNKPKLTKEELLLRRMMGGK